MKDTVILGGGRTGRGFIGRLLTESGIRFTILDKNRTLIDALNQKGHYFVKFFSLRPPVKIDHFEAYETSSPRASEIIKNAKNIFISVGAENLEAAALYMNKNQAHPENIVICENAIEPSLTVQSVFKRNSAINFVETAVFCTTINSNDNPVDICSDEYHKLPFDALKGKNSFFRAPFFEPEKNFPALLKLKKYTCDTASAIIAYNGWRLGYLNYAEAANDPEIQKLLHGFYTAIINAICSEYGMSPNVQRQFAKLSLLNSVNREINDTIEQNARQPLRKLGPNERIAFPMKLLLKYNFNIQPLCKTAALAVLYGEMTDSEWRKRFGTGQAGLVFSLLSSITEKSVIASVDFEYKRIIKPKYSVFVNI